MNFYEKNIGKGENFGAKASFVNGVCFCFCWHKGNGNPKMRVGMKSLSTCICVTSIVEHKYTNDVKFIVFVNEILMFIIFLVTCSKIEMKT